MSGFLAPDLADAMRAQAIVKETSFHMAMQLIIRSILLKLNSTEAHKLMKEQLIEQVKVVAKLWVDNERGTLREGFANDIIKGEQLDEFERRLGKLEGAIVREASGHIDAIFSIPEDVAGIY